jgi:hypothetical protein
VIYVPSFIKLIVGKLNLELNQNFDVTILFLKDLIAKTKDKFLKQKLIKDLYAVKAERDLNCLNRNEKNCDKLDSLGMPYLKKNNIYESKYKFKHFRVNRKK